MSNSVIVYKMYNPTGMINQLMSFEIAIGLAHEIDKRLILFNSTANKNEPIYAPTQNFIVNDRKGLVGGPVPKLFDVIDFDSSDSLLISYDQIDYFNIDNFKKYSIENSYYSSSTEVSELESIFANGRVKIIPDEKDMYIDNSLSWYSYFFFNRSKSLDKKLSSVKFKKEYFDFAKMVADSIGKFNGIHLRLSDHLDYFNLTKDIFENGLNQIEDNGYPIVLCTDEPNNDMVKTASKTLISIDQYIIENFYNEFKKLPFNDEVILGLVSNLIMHYSIDFVGNPSSTYSAYIHRNRNQVGIEKWKFSDGPYKEDGEPFSWIGAETGSHHWWREWKESKLNV